MPTSLAGLLVGFRAGLRESIDASICTSAGKTTAVGILLALIACAVRCEGQVASIEFSHISDPKRVGVDAFTLGADNLMIGFDVLPEGSEIPAGTVVNSAYASVGVRFSAVLTNGPNAGQRTDTQALDLTQAPNSGPQVAISPPNILSGVDPARGANASGAVAGFSTLRVTFLTPNGNPGKVTTVGAFNDLFFDANILTAYAGPDATGAILGSVAATRPGDFFGLRSTDGIGSVRFAGRSTEIDDLVFGPVFVAGTPTIGDMDFDGNIDFDDISGFMLALTNESEYFGIYGVRAEIHGDTDRSGFHDFDDIDGFVAIMSNDAPDSALRAVPEPSTFLAVLIMWTCGVLGFRQHLLRAATVGGSNSRSNV